VTEPDSLDGVPLAHRSVQLSEVALHVAEAGAGDRLVVLLHGFPEYWYSWRKQIPALARAGFRVAAPDLRGYNTSGKPGRVSDYALEKLARDVSELVRALGAERADVVGHDWGGVVAWAFAMLHGDQLGRLAILNAPHPLQYRRLLRRDLGQLRRSWYVLFFQLPLLPERLVRAGNFAALAGAFRGLRARGRMSEEELGRFRDALAQPGALTAAINYYRAGVRGSGKRLPFQPVRGKVQVIWGQGDRYLKPALAQPDPRWAPEARVDRLDGAGHFVHVDQPEKVNALLLEHLSAR